MSTNTNTTKKSDCGCSGSKSKSSSGTSKLPKVDLPTKLIGGDPNYVQPAVGLIIEADQTLIHDIDKGPLKVEGALHIRGKLQLVSTSGSNDPASIEAAEILNTGSVESESGVLKLITSRIMAPEGRFSASKKIVLDSSTGLQLRGGSFSAELLRIQAQGDMGVYADRIDAKISVNVKGVMIGVKRGSLNIVEQEYDGDPRYWTGDGDIDVGHVPPSKGEDLYFYCTGNINIDMADTTGGPKNSAAHRGRIRAYAGLTKMEDSIGNSHGAMPEQCSNCDFVIGHWDIEYPLVHSSGIVTINGEVQGQDFWAAGHEIDIKGNITILATSWKDGGNVLLLGNKSVKVLGDIFADNSPANRNPGGEGQMSSNVSIHGNEIDIQGSITAGGVDVFPGETLTPGDVKLGKIQATFSVNLNSGDLEALPVCGGGLQAKRRAARKLIQGAGFTVNPGRIQASEISAKGRISLLCTGDIQAGAITLHPSTISGTTAPHEVRVYAHAGGDENSSVFNLGGGGTNGCNSITVHGTTQGPSGPWGGIAVGCPGGITVASGGVKANANQDGAPAIVLDAGDTGVITVQGDLISKGEGNARAGYIILNGKELVASGVEITAKDDLTTTQLEPPYIDMAFSTITTSGELKVNCECESKAKILMAPKGSIKVNWTSDNVRICDFAPTEEELKFAGSGMPNVSAKSEQPSISLYGTPLKFEQTGEAKFEALGEEALVSVSHQSSSSAGDTLISSAGPVTMISRDPQGDGGDIEIEAAGVNIDSLFSLLSNTIVDGNGGGIYINASGDITTIKHEATSFRALADGRGSQKTAGNIDIFSGGRLTMDGALLTSNGDQDASGNVVYLSSPDDFKFTGGRIEAKGEGVGLGGNITLSTEGALDMPVVHISASGGEDNGNAGFVSITSSKDMEIGVFSIIESNGVGSTTDDNILLSSQQMLSSKGTLESSYNGSQDGQAGQISINAAETITLGNVYANGFTTIVGVQKPLFANNVKGGTINIDTPAKLEQFLSSTREVNGKGAGKGGNINILLDELEIPEDISGFNFTANGGDQGDGGEIKVFNNVDLAVANATVPIFLAKGFGNGKGGDVLINKMPMDVDILTVIDITAGENATTNERVGTITLNMRTCSQWKIAGPQVWPKRVWLGSSTQKDPDIRDSVLFSLPLSPVFNSLRGLFDTNKVELFLFDGADGYGGFFRDVLFGAVAGGITVKLGHIYSCPWKSGSIGGPSTTFDEIMIQEVIAHELGHAYDISSDFPSLSESYKTALTADLNHLDQALDETVTPPIFIDRKPCAKTIRSDGSEHPEPAPFSGMVDLSGNLNICVNGELNEHFGNAINRQVIQAIEAGLLSEDPNVIPPVKRWIELHAQMFAYQAVGNKGARPMLNTLLDREFFPALRLLALSEFGS